LFWKDLFETIRYENTENVVTNTNKYNA